MDDTPKDYSKLKDLGPKQYDPHQRPKLFTELDPAGLQDEKDQYGNVLTPLQAGARAVME